VYLAAWMPLLLLSGVPALAVRTARRKRVMSVEQDLPLTLDLLATLAEAGLGLDAAIGRVVDSQPRDRPLFQEFRTFQRDLLAGRSRIEALRHLSRRLEVIWFNIFISAVIQAEQIGAGLAEVLRIQADDLRSRRRERALAFAMAIPVKLLGSLGGLFSAGDIRGGDRGAVLSDRADAGFLAGPGAGRRIMRTAGPLVCRDTGEVVVEHLEIADGFWIAVSGFAVSKIAS
jgi:hypothetical protein